MILSYTGICFVWCIEEKKSNDIVCCESDIQCRYFWYNSDMNFFTTVFLIQYRHTFVFRGSF